MLIDIEKPTINAAGKIGFNCAGMMASIDWSSPDEVNKLVNTINQIQPDTLRVFDGGGYRYVHTMFDENGNPSKGLGYRESQIQQAFDDGILDEEEYKSYMGKLEKQNELDFRYIDKFCEIYTRFVKKPKVIYVVNVRDESVENELAAVKLLAENVNLYGVEMGNETYGHTFDRDFDFYADACRAYAIPITEQFPAVKISIVAAPIGEKRFEKWNQGLSALIQSPTFRIDAIVPHIYHTVKDGADFEAAYEEFKMNSFEETTTRDFLNQELYEQYDSATTFATYDLPIIIEQYAQLAAGKEMWITEWGIKPAHPFANTMVDAAFVILAMQALYHPGVTIACHQTLLGPDFHGSMTISKPGDLVGFDTPVFRAKMFSWLILSDLPCYEFCDWSLDMLTGIHQLYYRFNERVAVITINPRNEELNDLATISEERALGFNSIMQAQFSSIFNGHGVNDIFKMNEFYDGKECEYNVILSVGEEADVCMPYSISVSTYSLIIPVEEGDEPEEEVPGDEAEEVDTTPSRPHIKLPKYRKGFFKRMTDRYNK